MGTWVPISMTPSAAGRVLSNTVELVKLRMEKLSSHFKGQATRRPFSSYSTRIRRANIMRQFNHSFSNHHDLLENGRPTRFLETSKRRRDVGPAPDSLDRASSPTYASAA